MNIDNILKERRILRHRLLKDAEVTAQAVPILLLTKKIVEQKRELQEAWRNLVSMKTFSRFLTNTYRADYDNPAHYGRTMLYAEYARQKKENKELRKTISLNLYYLKQCVRFAQRNNGKNKQSKAEITI
jgi:hypothetical protein